MLITRAGLSCFPGNGYGLPESADVIGQIIICERKTRSITWSEISPRAVWEAKQQDSDPSVFHIMG